MSWRCRECGKRDSTLGSSATSERAFVCGRCAVKPRRKVGLALPSVSLAFVALALSVMVSCALFSAKTPAEVAAAAVLDAKQSNETAARACALYRAGVTLGEVTPQPEVTKACDEAYPL